MKRFSQFIINRYILVLLTAAALLAASVFYASKLKVQTNISGLLPKDSDLALAQQEFSKYFNSEDSVLVAVQGDGELCRSYVDALAGSIDSRGIAAGVLYKVIYSEIEPWLPLYADAGLYRSLEQGEITPARFAAELAASQGDGEGEYLVSEDGSTYMMVIKPALPGEDLVSARERFFTGLLDAMDQVRMDGVEAGYTGGTFVQDYQADSVMFDSLSTTTVIALILIILLIIGSFGRVLLPAMSALPLIMGVAMAAAFAALLYGSVNAFTISFAALLLGLGIDFAIHILNKYFQERRQGRGAEESLERAVSETGTGIVIGAATTAFAFLAFLFAQFKAFVQMAVVSGVGIVLLCAVMLLVVPALVMLVDGRGKRKEPVFYAKYRFLTKLGSFSQKRAACIIAAAVLLTAGSVACMLRIKISTNLMDIYPSNLPSGKWLKVVEEEFDYNPNTLSVMVDSVDELKRAAAGLRDAEGVRSVSSALDYLPPEQEYKADILAKAGVPVPPMTVGDLPESVRGNFIGKGGKLLLEIIPEGKLSSAEEYETLKKSIREATGRVPVGMPAVMNEVIGYVKSDVLIISLLCLGMILVLLLIAYRSLKIAVITMTPVVLSVIATLGVMELFGFTTTIFSIIGLPLVIGIGIDSGVHMMHSMLIEDDAAVAVVGTGKAVIMTTLTTLIGFGSIAFSNHKGLAGLGMTVVVGMALCMVVTLVLLPALKIAFIKKRATAKQFEA